MMNKISIYLLFIAALIGIGFQYAEQDLDPAYRKYLDEKVNSFKKERMKKCKENAIEEAVTIVDSIFRVHLDNLRIDSIFTPEKSIRPTKPELEIPKDKKELIPIIEQRTFDSVGQQRGTIPDTLN